MCHYDSNELPVREPCQREKIREWKMAHHSQGAVVSTMALTWGRSSLCVFGSAQPLNQHCLSLTALLMPMTEQKRYYVMRNGRAVQGQVASPDRAGNVRETSRVVVTKSTPLVTPGYLTGLALRVAQLFY